MGNIDSIQQRETFEALLTALKIRDINAHVIIANGRSFDFIHDGLSFFHYLAIEAFWYERDTLQKLCDTIYEYRNKFGSCKILSGTKYLQLEYENKTTLIGYYSQNYYLKPTILTYYMMTGTFVPHHELHYVRTYYKNIHNISNIDPMTLCLIIKTKFLVPKGLKDNLDIVIDLFNKISPSVCVLCKAKLKDIMIKPCKHVCLCHNCLKNRTTCPICKGIITASEKVIL